MPWSYVSLGILLLAGLLLLLCLIAAVATLLVLRPPRMTDGKAIVVLKRLSPGDLHLPFEDIRFDVKDDFTGRTIPIAGWWIEAEHPSDRCVILLHGYSDAKVGGIAWAPLWHNLGFNVLAMDLRAHGQSGGRYCTAGWYERWDVSRVIDILHQERPQASRRMVLFGASLGAAVAAATAAIRDDIDAVVMDCPYADFGRAAATHARVWGMPRGRISHAIMRLAQWISRSDFEAVRPVELVRQIKCPVMVIRSGQDFLVDAEDADKIEAAMSRRTSDQGPSLYWDVPEAGHILALAARPQEYASRMQQFIHEALRRDAATGSVSAVLK